MEVKTYVSNSNFTLPVDEDLTPNEHAPYWDLVFTEGSIQKCLHGSIVLPAIYTANINPRFANVNLPEKTWSATNDTDWTDYICDIETRMTGDGLYEKDVHTAKAPDITEPTLTPTP